MLANHGVCVLGLVATDGLESLYTCPKWVMKAAQRFLEIFIISSEVGRLTKFIFAHILGYFDTFRPPKPPLQVWKSGASCFMENMRITGICRTRFGQVQRLSPKLAWFCPTFPENPLYKLSIGLHSLLTDVSFEAESMEYSTRLSPDQITRAVDG